ncbi:MAG: ATP-binding protein [Desulfomonilaceae bacterium]|nr:ATP-binding protein [Desulfomonilaceae bacterium]
MPKIQEEHPVPMDSIGDPKRARIRARNGEQTQTIDLGLLFPSDVTESGSFDLTRVKYASFGKLLQALSVPTLLVDKLHRIEFVNEAFAGISKDVAAAVGQRVAAVFSDPADARAMDRMIEQVFRQRRPEVREKTLRIYGKRMWARVHLRTIRLAQERLVLLQLENLTAQKQLLAVEKYRKLVKIFPVGMVEFAPPKPLDRSLPEEMLLAAVMRSKVVDGNAEFADFYRVKHVRDLLGMEFSKLFPCFGKAKGLCLNWIREGFAGHTFETKERRRSGQLCYYENTFIGNIGNETVLSFWWLKRDISEKKRSEEEMLKKDKLDSLGILAGGIAHDFNNLLTALLGNLSLLDMSPHLGDKESERVDAAMRACSRAQQLTLQLLTFSKGGAPIKKTACIGDLLRDSVEFSLRGSKVRSEYSIPNNIWNLDVDEGQIHQVINNLVINAIQAMPSGGVVRVQATNVKVSSGSGTPLPVGRYVRISISDSGVGIPEQNLKKVFDPYFTTKEHGSGLGLATSYSVIRKHGGLMTVRSKVGEGSTFSLYLPASEATVDCETRRKRSPEPASARVLLMDDDVIIREMSCEMLTVLGYDVVVCQDGEEAVAAYAKARETGKPFDVVIMDLTVPGGMGGTEALKKLSAIDPKVKAVVSSGYSNDPVMADFTRYGFTAVLPKPYGAEDLGSLLDAILSKNGKP